MQENRKRLKKGYRVVRKNHAPEDFYWMSLEDIATVFAGQEYYTLTLYTIIDPVDPTDSHSYFTYNEETGCFRFIDDLFDCVIELHGKKRIVFYLWEKAIESDEEEAAALKTLMIEIVGSWQEIKDIGLLGALNKYKEDADFLDELCGVMEDTSA